MGACSSFKVMIPKTLTRRHGQLILDSLKQKTATISKSKRGGLILVRPMISGVVVMRSCPIRLCTKPVDQCTNGSLGMLAIKMKLFSGLVILLLVSACQKYV